MKVQTDIMGKHEESLDNDETWLVRTALSVYRSMLEDMQRTDPQIWQVRELTKIAKIREKIK